MQEIVWGRPDSLEWRILCNGLSHWLALALC
jgi:hypothetical protein